MIYVIVEDEGASFDFWEIALKQYIVSNAVYDTAKGKDKLESKVDSLGLTSNDALILIYDNINDKGVKSQIKNIEKEHYKVGFKYYWCDYYCFEKLIISISYLESFVNPQIVNTGNNQNVVDMMKELRLNLTEENLQDIVSSYSDLSFLGSTISKTSTLETIYSTLLNQYTRLSRIAVTVDKSRIGNCWLKDCRKVKNQPYICNNANCIFKGQGLVTLDKIRLIEANSLLSNATVPLSYLSNL